MKRELLDNGNIWRKGDGRWIGMVRYKDEFGVTQRKSFSAKKKKCLLCRLYKIRPENLCKNTREKSGVSSVWLM